MIKFKVLLTKSKSENVFDKFKHKSYDVNNYFNTSFKIYSGNYNRSEELLILFSFLSFFLFFFSRLVSNQKMNLLTYITVYDVPVEQHQISALTIWIENTQDRPKNMVATGHMVNYYLTSFLPEHTSLFYSDNYLSDNFFFF